MHTNEATTLSRAQETLLGATNRVRTAHGTLYVTANKSPSDKLDEIILHLGKAGSCEAAHSQAMGRLISICLRQGVPIEEIIGQLSHITCCPHFDEGRKIHSVPDAISVALEKEHAR